MAQDGAVTATTLHRLPDLVPPPTELPPRVAALRAEVREFLAEERAAGRWTPRADVWLSGWDERFSRELARRGWLGMTIPREYGGHGASALDRYVVTEELLTAGAPVGAHWVADRQSGPLLLRFGTEDQRQSILPRIARGECYFAIGMSEPDSGSDLASLRTSATKVEGGWVVNGRKIWSSGAHICDYMIALVRTAPRDESKRHEGMSQFLIDLKTKGISIRGIRNVAGESHFNETLFENVFVPDSMVIGKVGDGWKQVVTELSIERSGPERFLSTFVVLREAVRELGEKPGDRAAHNVGQLVARVATLRRMSLGVSGLLREGKDPVAEAALVKDVGTRYEKDLLEVVRPLLPSRPQGQSYDAYGSVLRGGILQAPSFSLRGGTNEVLRGIVARELGLR